MQLMKRAMMTHTLIMVTLHKQRFLRRKKKKKCIVLLLMMMKRSNIPLLEANSEVGRICSQQLDVGAVHTDLGEAHEFLLEVVHEEIVGDNPLKQQYKTPSLAIENSNDKVFNNFALVLGSGHSFGSAHSEGISSGSPSSGGTNLGGQNSPGCWGPIYPQWRTPPNVAQWGTTQNAPQWGTPPTAPQWGTPPNTPQWGTPPTATQWGTPPNAQQWGQTQNFQQGGSTGTTPTNVQYGFSVGGQGDGATVETSPIIQRTSSSGLGFTNYFETGQMPQTPRPGGLFNIWGTPKGSNASHQSDAFRICQLRSQGLNNLSYEERIEL
ncbi:unnamed protein product [Arabidopsis lyrata]|nr:unnamed protein product [Arabidopsis lyrata]